MAAINLDSLRTFWSSIKNYLNNHFSDETVLWSGSPATSVTLSESMSNFKEIRIDYRTNDTEIYTQFFVPNQTSSEIALMSAFCPNNANAYIKMAIYSMNNDKTTLTHNRGKETKMTTSGTISTYNATLLKIVKVVGKNRI